MPDGPSEAMATTVDPKVAAAGSWEAELGPGSGAASPPAVPTAPGFDPTTSQAPPLPALDDSPDSPPEAQFAAAAAAAAAVTAAMAMAGKTEHGGGLSALGATGGGSLATPSAGSQATDPYAFGPAATALAPAAVAVPAPASQAATTPLPASTRAPTTTTKEFFGLINLHPEEPTADFLVTTTAVVQTGQLSKTMPSWTTKLWRRRRLQQVNEAAMVVGEAGGKQQEQDPEGISLAKLQKTLRTLMLWVSWVHEDVGHSMAAFVYNPVHTPMFVPEDGEGIPMLPYVFAAMAYRDFIFVERPKLLDAPPDHWFSKQVCQKQMLLFRKCQGPDDKKCFADFQDNLRLLSSKAAFKVCDHQGFFSCLDRVEISASS